MGFLNDVDYCGGFKQEDIDQLFQAIQSNYKAWCSGFAPLVVGGDMDSPTIQEFSRTLFNMRPYITLHLLCYVTVPCHLIHSMKDMSVPIEVSEYFHRNLGSESIVEVIPSEGHLPQLSSPVIVICVFLRHIHYDIAI
ncbi:hypothetical protein CsSME_00003637 [Camellia sinensis var. sinensis]